MLPFSFQNDLLHDRTVLRHPTATRASANSAIDSHSVREIAVRNVTQRYIIAPVRPSEALQKVLREKICERFKHHALRREIVLIALDDYGEQRKEERTLETLTAELLKRKFNYNPDAVRAAAAHARKSLESFDILIDGYYIRTTLDKRVYRLIVKQTPDPLRHLKYFWKPYLGAGEDPVIVGVLARLFFRLRHSEWNDQVFIRSPLVNRRGHNEVAHSPIVQWVLGNSAVTADEYRQYMSSGDVEAAFSVLTLFHSLGHHGIGVRLPGGTDVSRSHRVLLGSGKMDGVPTSRPNQDYLFEKGPEGITRRNGHVVPEFTDDWKTLTLHVLVSRWIDANGYLVTTIHSNAADAVFAIAKTLCHKEAVRIVLDCVADVTEMELPFRVQLAETVDRYEPVAISVWGKRSCDESQRFHSIRVNLQ